MSGATSSKSTRIIDHIVFFVEGPSDNWRSDPQAGCADPKTASVPDIMAASECSPRSPRAVYERGKNGP